ncbi:hypothetical protein J5O08_18515, partial [Cellulomonas sp. PS-H5]|nr:hypothetical protein [Cellulomonas sp. PS-H5]
EVAGAAARAGADGTPTLRDRASGVAAATAAARADRPATGTRGGPRPSAGTADPAEALGLLREAAAGHTEVWLEVVGSRGALERRRVLPVRVDGGRVRVVDTARDAEIVVAAHRVAAVTPVDAAGTEPAADDDAAADPRRTDTA